MRPSCGAPTTVLALMKIPKTRPYFFSRVVAGLVSILGALTILASLILMLFFALPANPIQAALYQGASTRVLPLACLGLIVLAF